MDHQKMQGIVWQLLTDAEFRAKLLSDTEATLTDHDLSEEEKGFLMDIVEKANHVEDFASVIATALEKRDSKGFANIG